jgi:hypothetical protein
MYKYNLNYKGNTVKANTYLVAARLLNKLTNDPISIIYKELTGRYPSHKMLEEAYSFEYIWQRDRGE